MNESIRAMSPLLHFFLIGSAIQFSYALLDIGAAISTNLLLYFVAYVSAVEESYPIIVVAAGIVSGSSYITVVAELNVILVKLVQPENA